MNATVEETRGAVREAVRGVTERFGRAYFLERARSGGYVGEMWQALAELGLLGVGVPEEYGGSSTGITGPVAVMESLSQAGTPPLLYLLTCFGRVPIIRYGSDDLNRRIVARTVTGDVRLSFAITEPDAGTNAFAMATNARRHGDNYLLNGQKTFISGADEADYAVVVVRTTPLREVDDKRNGLSLFVVPTDTPGVEMAKMDIDLQAADRQYTVYFSDAEVGRENLIGEEGKGFYYLFDALNPERLLVAAWALGLGDFALAKATAYARERAPFGKPIGAYQGVQHPLARAKAHLEAARSMLYDACTAFDARAEAGAAANMAKLLASEAAMEAMDAAIQTHGGSAFDAEADVVTLWPMVRLLKIAPVNNEMILNYIGERVLGLPKSY